MEEAAHTYDAAAMAYAAGADTDTNFLPTAAQLATLGQPVCTSALHLVGCCDGFVSALMPLGTLRMLLLLVLLLLLLHA